MNLDANLAAILTLITAITTAVVTVINSVRNSKKFKDADVKLDDQTKQLTEIHTQTNGTLSTLRERIAALEAENINLDETNRMLSGDRRGNGHLARKKKKAQQGRKRYGSKR